MPQNDATGGGDSTSDGERGSGGVKRFIERNRSNLEGNPTEYARGFEACLDSLEEFVGEEVDSDV